MTMGLYELVLLKQGTRGNAVKKLQEKLGVTADGQFGSGTEKALREYQQKNGLGADGVAGPATLAQMKLFNQITADTVKASQVPASSIPEGPRAWWPMRAPACAASGTPSRAWSRSRPCMDMRCRAGSSRAASSRLVG
jgi:hypothetical protein